MKHMTLLDVLKVITPATRVRLLERPGDPGIRCLRYSLYDESGLVDPIVSRTVLEKDVVLMQIDSAGSLLIRVRK